MRRLLIALLFLVGGAETAWACSCVRPTEDPAEMRRLARELAVGAVALVEVDVRSAYDPGRRLGELMRVRRTLAGRAPREFRVARDRPPSSAGCDVEHARGTTSLVLIYRAAGRWPTRQQHFREGGLCTNLLLGSARFRQMVVEAMRGRAAEAVLSDDRAELVGHCRRPVPWV